MKELFILQYHYYFTPTDPDWRSIGTLDEYDRYPKVLRPTGATDIVAERRLRIPLVRKHE